MKNLKSLRLPRWIIKRIQPGKENEDLTSLVVGIIALYAVGAIAYFAYAPFGREHLYLEVIAAIAILVLIVRIGLWLIAQVAHLDSLRREAVIIYKNSKTEKEEKEATTRLEELYVPIPKKESEAA
jgi:hypothetical protein